MRRPAAVADLLSSMLRGTPAEQRLKEGRIWVVWEQAVGKRIAAHAQPAAFREGTLTLTVDSAPWMQQLSFLKRELVAKVNDQLGYDLVKELYFKAGKVAKAAPTAKPAPAKRRQLSDEEREWITQQSDAVTDPDLRAVFESLIKRDRENR
jgi:predicted nucleic acid-binding Zn ribbon protein